MKCCEIHAGKLKDAVIFQRASLVSDGAGGQAQTWAAVSNAPARAWVAPLSGSEQYRFDRMEANISMKLITRYSTAIQERDRVVIRSRNYNVRFIKNVDFEDKWLEVYVNGGVAV